MARRWLPTLRRTPLATKLTSGPAYAWAPVSLDRAQPWSVERAVRDGMERAVWVYKAVDTISNHAADRLLRVRPISDRSDEPAPPLPDHPLYRVMNRTANPLEWAWVFKKRLSMQLLLSKRGAFIEPTFSRGGDLLRVELLPPGRTRPVPGNGADLIDHFETVTPTGELRTLDPDQVRWIRNPHPLDPYSGMTPLEAAGLSVDLDHFTRLYNLSFVHNDSRPGGIISIDGDMEPDELRLLRSKFATGPTAAGTWTVLAGGGITVTDTSTTPRDMAYETVSGTAKIEVLAAFGVPESQLGNASGRTYDNAQAEKLMLWEVTMPPHLTLLASAFQPDVDDGHEAYFDTSDIDVLRMARANRLKEARDEVDAGVRSPLSYAKLAGYADEMDDTPATRALWLTSGRTPVPARATDATALAAAAAPPAPAAAAKSHPATSEEELQLDGTAAHALQQRLEDALQALTVRWTERTVARLNSPRHRTGTRHWDHRGQTDLRTGGKELPVDAVLDAATWQAEAEQALRPAVEQAANAAAEEMNTALAATISSSAPGWPTIAPLLADSVAQQAASLAKAIRDDDQAGTDREGIIATIRAWGRSAATWASSAATRLATTVIEAARDHAATATARTGLVRRWVAHQDTHTRSEHADADGQTQPLGQPFTVGTNLLRHPGDPTAPPGQTINCRCRLAWTRHG
ncbi:phage portal protein [Kitasatospora sp. RB6PN24]|uniref:phage portal protein n=1 Tax=Kitasatospora humi TaxID=2893891 RepID=UPI001E3572C5|nr:phage portal protein [Kitasatospora humi]MCC9309284.1 phage portal protein [Kitasatospora humi]